MKLGLMKRLIATGLCAAMMFGDVLPVTAMGSVSGGDAAVVVNENTVSANDAEVIAEIEPVQMEELVLVEDAVLAEESVSGNDAIVALAPVTVDGVTITVSGPASAFAEGTTVSAVEVDPAEVVIAAAEENEQATVKKYKAFDINLICDGEVVQPLNGAEIKVNFEGDMLIPDVENNEDVAVYHVDENDNITKMEAGVAPLETEEVVATETVEMTTTHFSTYVVVITGSDYSVTYAHYADVDGDGDEEQFYKPFSEEVKAGTKKTYTDFKAAGKTVGGDDYTISYIVIDFADANKADIRIDAAATNPANVDVEIESTATINIHYVPVTGTYINDVNFYDYYLNKSGNETGRTFRAVVRANQDGEKDKDNIYANGLQYRTDSYNRESITLQQRYSDNYITLGIGDELTNVTYNGTEYENAVYAGNGLFREVSVISINDIGANYQNRFLGIGREGDREQYGDFQALNGNGGYANAMNGDHNAIIVTGLVDGLTPDLKNVDWGKTTSGQDIMEPGYFTDVASDVKAVYNKDEFKLKFTQTGHNFELFSAINQATQRETYVKYQQSEFNDDGSYKTYDSQPIKEGEISTEFFPLEDVPSRQVTETYSGKEYNWYYGMRYDFTFTLGDYIGPLEYGFIGDDDLWVFVDGELVMDLGGVHSAYPTRYQDVSGTDISVVDLWDEYFGVTKEERANPNWWQNIAALAEEGKYNPNKEYQVTVLYMERGGCASSCYMEFTLPNVDTRTVTENYGEFSVVKKDSMTEEVVSGAGFTLYSDAACTTVKGSASSDHNGIVRFANLTVGEYYLKETTAPVGYIPTDKVWKIVVTEETVNNTTTVNVDMFDGNVELTTGVITNDPIIDPIDVEFTKVDLYNNDKTLEGATFTLSDESGSKVLQTVTSGADGKIKFTELEEGVYTIKETEAPEGYVLSDSQWTLTVTLNRTAKKYEYTTDVPNKVLTNEPYVDFEFTKVNSETDELIGGAEFTLYKGLSDSKTETVATVKSDANGKVKFEDLRAGQDYLLVETETPYGYVAPKTPWVIRVDYVNGEPVQKIFAPTLVNGSWTYDSNTVVNTDVVENDPAYGSLKITKRVDKIDSAYGTPSFTFKIVGPKGAVYYGVITFDDANVKEKTIEIKDLPVGFYTVTEMDSLQYTLKSSDAGDKEVTETNTPVFVFENELDGEDYSHSDVVVNSFRRNANGEIEISKNREVIE